MRRPSWSEKLLLMDFAKTFIATILALIFGSSLRLVGQDVRKPFTVADDIALTVFGHPNSELTEAVQFSPDGKFLLVFTERGRLDVNRVENSMRFYRSGEVRNFVADSNAAPPSPIWVVTSLADREVEGKWRWLADSSGVAFLEGGANSCRQLFLADLRRRKLWSLTSNNEDVVDFDVRDRNHFVYSLIALKLDKHQEQRPRASIVGTGRPLWQLLFPDDPRVREVIAPAPRQLWAVVFGKRFEIKHAGKSIDVSSEFSLSPGGHFLATSMAVSDVPVSWANSFHVQTGYGSSVHQYVLIDLLTGSIRPLTNAPVSNDATAIVQEGEWALSMAVPRWSADGQSILLPGTFIRSAENILPRPCVAVYDLPTDTSTCVESLKKRHTEAGDREEGFHYVTDVRFLGGSKQQVVVSYDKTLYGDVGYIAYRLANGTWQVEAQRRGSLLTARNGLGVGVQEELDKPPVLVATAAKASRLLWDPNPKLRALDMGQASVYTWKDRDGHQWKAGLYKPSNYKPGVSYPLVIQTHGFVESRFSASGLYPTAFSARALAAAGIIVVQVAEHGADLGFTPEEAPASVGNYQSVVDQLVAEGLADPEKIGIIGFSHTCYYVMEALTTRSLHVKAASINEGEFGGYFQYVQFPDTHIRLLDSEIGASPFGTGLQQWLKRSPGFNLDKVTAPLMVVGNDPLSVLLMWEPYSGLHRLHKPVDFIMLHSNEHVLTNPYVRLVSQGESVEWFRFWLKDEEDPDPSKAAQYVRWRELRKFQDRNQDTNGK